MAKTPKKLVTWKQWVVCTCAAFGGVAYAVGREYHYTGSIQTITIANAAIAFCLAVAIMIVIFRYANRPERGEKK